MNGGSGVPRRLMPQVYLNPEVVDVADLDGGGLQFQNLPGPGAKRKREFVQITRSTPSPAP
jgi:putative ABC transport system permease protein